MVNHFVFLCGTCRNVSFRHVIGKGSYCKRDANGGSVVVVPGVYFRTHSRQAFSHF